MHGCSSTVFSIGVAFAHHFIKDWHCGISNIRHLRHGLQVRSTDGDTRLGGEDIDARLVEHFLGVFKDHSGIDLSNAKDGDKKKKALSKLRGACAQLKVDLSRMTESDICLDELYQVCSRACPYMT